MAVLRKEIQVKRLSRGDKDVFDCLVELFSDFSDPDMDSVGIGSMAFCLEDSKLYAKDSSEEWVEVVV